VLVKGAEAPRYAAAPGMLLYSHAGSLFAVPWRPPQTGLGRAVPVALPERLRDSGGNEGVGNYTMSGDGTLAYLAAGLARYATRLVWIDRLGKIEPAPLPERIYENVMISPDGARAIVQIREGTTTLWIFDLARNTMTPMGNSTGSSQSAAWTADGMRVIYRGTRKGFRNLYWRPADGSGDEERLTTKPDVVHAPTSVSSDGQWLLFNENGAQDPGGVSIWLMRLDGDRTPRRLFQPPAGEQDGQFSPDGRWVAFQAPVSSRQEIYVAPFPGPGPRRQVSTDGGTEPLWSTDGRELFFQSGSRLMGVNITSGAAFSAGTPRVVHEGRFLKSINGNTPSTITRDGRRFLRIQQVEPERAITHIDLVLNWFEELTRVVAGGTK
jgi:dipeptidyl aminopeptidase/acylaminoacyl peptidase